MPREGEPGPPGPPGPPGEDGSPGGGGNPLDAWPVGSIYQSTLATSPAVLFGGGTWAALAGLFLVGIDPGQTEFDVAGETGGGKTHTHAGHAAHAVTQPAAHSDHGALSHSAHAGAAVGAHTFTQPSAHAAHVVTQPNGHSAHVVTQPNNHTDVLNHTHPENRNSATTGGLDGWAAGDTSTSTPLQTGYVTGNPTANGVAAQVHAGAAVDAHSAHAGAAVDAHSAHTGGAVDAHSVTQPSAHSDHAAASHSAHSGAAVDAHSAHDSPANLPPYTVVYMWERTA